jgi:CBS domain-containing protein
MRVADMMQTEVQTVPVDTPVNEIFVTLADSRISALPVVDSAGHLLGVISRSDILASNEEAEENSQRLLQETPVRDLMTSPALTIAPSASVREAAKQMLAAGVHRLIVTDGEHIVGVISTADIVSAVAAGRL